MGRVGETVKTRKKREKTEKKWARYGLKRVNKERTGGINWGGTYSLLITMSVRSHMPLALKAAVILPTISSITITMAWYCCRQR